MLGFDDAGKTVLDDEDENRNALLDCEPEDLVHFGLIPELVGRLPVISALDALDKAALVRVLCEPRNALTKQYRKLLAMENVELDFTSDALEAIADKAVKRGTGARGLRALMEELMLEVMFNAPSVKEPAKCMIGEKHVRGEEQPELERV